MSEDLDIVYFHPPQIDPVVWMQFIITKKKDRAHVFQQDHNNKSVLYSLCLRWQVRKIRNTGFSALEKADQDRPRCKLCEKRLKEINNG